jgi:hypothetical protein
MTAILGIAAAIGIVLDAAISAGLLWALTRAAALQVDEDLEGV